MRPKRIPQRVVQREMGRRIVDLRRQRGWKQGDLAAHMQVPSGRLSKWERGLNAPSLEDLIVLAAVLNVTCHELIEGRRHARRDRARRGTEPGITLPVP